MKKFGIPTYITLFLIVGTAVWYFGHYQPAQKIRTAEPKKVYVTTPVPGTPNVKHLDSQPPISPVQSPHVKEKEVENENMNSTPAPIPFQPFSKDEVNKGQSDHVLSEEFIQQYTPSIEGSTAFERFMDAQSVYNSALENFKSVLTPPVDYQVLKSATDALKNAKLQRTAALRNLAAYSEEAAELLAEEEATAAKVAEDITDFNETEAEFMKELRTLIGE